MNCHEMKKDQIYYCGDCGLEIRITNECSDCCGDTDEGECGCQFSCCGDDLKLRSAD